jgi:penicillin-binding protein 2
MLPYFASLPVEVGCKTGTAEVAGSDIANAVFVCFAPYDNPEVALCIVAEKGDSGGSLASVAAGMLAQYFSSGKGESTVQQENTLLP